MGVVVLHLEVSLDGVFAKRCVPDRAMSRPRRRARVSLAAGLAALIVVPTVLSGSGFGGALVPAAAVQHVSDLTDIATATEPTVAPAGTDPGGGAATTGSAVDPTAPRTIDTNATTRRLAEVDGLLVRLPTVTPLVVGFHEAATGSALAMTPVGRLVANRNTTRVTAPPDTDRGPDYLILSSRGRAQPATSAVDIVMTDDEPVIAPVTGTVSDLRGYLLYGGDADQRIEIVPADAPHLRVVLIHVTDVTVAVGDRVIAGHSVVARGPRRFSFTSQIDRETEPDRWPHVHLEVQPVDAPRPGGD